MPIPDVGLVDLVARAVLRLLQDHHESAAIRNIIRSMVFEELYLGQRESDSPEIHVEERGGVSYITVPTDDLDVNAPEDG